MFTNPYHDHHIHTHLFRYRACFDTLPLFLLNKKLNGAKMVVEEEACKAQFDIEELGTGDLSGRVENKLRRAEVCFPAMLYRGVGHRLFC
jgi:hypothetical protein